MEDSAKGARWTFEHTCQIQLHNTRETKSSMNPLQLFISCTPFCSHSATLLGFD